MEKHLGAGSFQLSCDGLHSERGVQNQLSHLLHTVPAQVSPLITFTEDDGFHRGSEPACSNAELTSCCDGMMNLWGGNGGVTGVWYHGL